MPPDFTGVLRPQDDSIAAARSAEADRLSAMQAALARPTISITHKDGFSATPAAPLAQPTPKALAEQAGEVLPFRRAAPSKPLTQPRSPTPPGRAAPVREPPRRVASSEMQKVLPSRAIAVRGDDGVVRAVTITDPAALALLKAMGY